VFPVLKFQESAEGKEGSTMHSPFFESPEKVFYFSLGKDGGLSGGEGWVGRGETLFPRVSLNEAVENLYKNMYQFNENRKKGRGR